MAFVPLNFEAGKTVLMPCATSLTVAKGDALTDDGNGHLTSAASGTAVDIRYVAAESVVTTFAGQQVRCYSALGGGSPIRFVADCDANPAQTDVGTYCDLATVATVNPDAVTNQLFFIESIKGAVGDRKVIGWFAHATPNS